MNSPGNATNERVGMAELTLILLTLFVLIAGTMVPLQGQTDPADDQRPAIARNSWSKGAAMPKALKFVMTGVIGGKVYVVGGVTNTAVVSENLVYNPLTNRWSSEAALPVATCDAASAVVKNVFYVFGGSTDGKTVTNAVWAYNPTTNKWSAKSPMPTARASAGAAVDNNIIFVIGGTDATNRFNTVESYNPVTDSWSKEASLIVGKSDLQLGCSEPRLWPPTDSAPLETPETMKGTTHPPTRGNR